MGGGGLREDMRWALAQGDMVCSRVDLFLRDYIIAFTSINIAHWVIFCDVFVGRQAPIGCFFVMFLLVDKPPLGDFL